MVIATAWVLDISVAAKWFLRDEDLLRQADDVLTGFGAGHIHLTAPAYFLDEGANMLRTAVVRGRCPRDRAQDDYAKLLALGIYIVEATAARRAGALELALDHGIAYYDALYIHLSRETGLPLLTADYPLYDRIHADFPTTVFLGALP